MTVAKLAKALNVNPEWLRTGKGDPARRITEGGTDEDEALAILRQLSPQNRRIWLAQGRILVGNQSDE